MQTRDLRRVLLLTAAFAISAIAEPTGPATQPAPRAMPAPPATLSLPGLLPAGAKLQKLAGGMKFIEGPVWLGRDSLAPDRLIFSDIPAEELKQWEPAAGVRTFRTGSHGTNGNTVDRQGRLISCEHLTRRVTRTEPNGSITVLADKFEGKKLNSPNDAAVRADGTIWFTDPSYGMPKGGGELDGHFVFRLDPGSGKLTKVADDFDQPNGICFSPDQHTLYIADSGRPHHIRAFDVADDGMLRSGRVFCVIDKGGPDGIRCDAHGNVWSSAGDGVHVFSPQGKLLGKIKVPETPANLCFGGPSGHTLFITARTSLYAIETNTAAPQR